MVPLSAVLATSMLLLHLSLAQRPPGTACQTPDNKAGTCVVLSDCGPMWAALLQRRRVINNYPAVEYLRRSQCGFVGNSPVVCCPKEDIAKGVSAGGSEAIKDHPGMSLLPKSCGHALTDYIVGGSIAQLGEHPWLAGLEYQTRTGVFVACGGALITNRYILTAAHCIARVPNAQLVSVRLGEHDLNTDPDCQKSRAGQVCAPPLQRIQVERVVPHPQYRSNSADKHFDIGLVRLRKDVELSDYVRPVCLPTGIQLEERGSSAAVKALKGVLTGTLAGTQQTVAGWGRTETNTRSDVKMRVTLPVLENEKCAQLYRGRVRLDATQMCAGGQAGKDSCSGDSGGPLMTNQAGQWVVTGVVSVGPQQCGTRDQPGVYTRVAPFLPWIMDNLSNSSLSCDTRLLGGGDIEVPGECIDVRLCTPAITLLRLKPRTNATTLRLLAARCGDPQAGIVHICCPLEYEQSTPASSPAQQSQSPTGTERATSAAEIMSTTTEAVTELITLHGDVSEEDELFNITTTETYTNVTSSSPEVSSSFSNVTVTSSADSENITTTEDITTDTTTLLPSTTAVQQTDATAAMS